MPEPRSGTRRAATDLPKAVRVWGEVGVTLAVTQEPPQFIRYSFGHERIAPNDSAETLARYETLVFETCNEAVEKRSRQLHRLIRTVNSDDESLHRPPRRRTRKAN